jgi:hypothetical protein
MALTNAQHQKRWREKRNRLAKEAEAMSRVTSKRRGRRAQPGDDVNVFISELFDFLQDYGQRLKAERAIGKLFDEDRAHLADALHTTANELSMMAQEMAGINSVER